MKKRLHVPVKTVAELPITQQIVTQQIPQVNTIASTQSFPAYTTSQTINSNHTNSDYPIEEINALKKSIIDKDFFIAKLINENQELTSKLNISEISKSSLISELTGLKEDKVDLREDKARLHEEILLLRKSALIDQEKLRLAEIEIDRVKQELIEFSLLESSIVQENVFVEPHNPLIVGDTVESILLSQEDSVLLGDSIQLAE